MPMYTEFFLRTKAVHVEISHTFRWRTHQPCPIMLDYSEAIYMYEGGLYGDKSPTYLVRTKLIIGCLLETTRPA